ncbi:MAG: helix-turn-helix domain-containing protein [Chitinophagia bacterium]|nr:helix-turn-helix domain-containing protein [Chitinophagia bacterium]
MEGAYMLEISKKIKKKRVEKDLTVQELANKSGVTKGMISQIENGRSIPSLPVLFKIISSLDMAVNDFFADMTSGIKDEPVIVRKNSDYEDFQKEDAVGFFYKRIFVQDVPGSTVDFVLLTLEPGATRPQVQTAALEYKYVISGSVSYIINGNTYELHTGDSIFFNGMMPHVPQTIGEQPAVMLIVYFFEQTN